MRDQAMTVDTHLNSAARARSGAVLTVDLNALRANYRLLRARALPAACSAVLKSDGYGLGAAAIGPALYDEGCRHFFVAHLDEGIHLRPHLPLDAGIFVLHGPMPGTEEDFFANGLVPVLNSAQQVAGWRAFAARQGRALDAIIQVDTGMSRMGLSPAEIDAWLQDDHYLDGITPRYVMSHLACADEPDSPVNAAQLERFTLIRARLREQLKDCPASLANSSGIFLSGEYHFDLVRPGAALYGIAPQPLAEANPMHSVVRLQGRVLQTRTIAAGEHVGYSLRYTATQSMRVATIAVGYADGWLRSMSNRCFALADGVRLPQIGTISMDSITLDASAVPEERLAPGSLVDLISPEHPVDAVARLANTIGYEILTDLGARYHREYLG